MMTKGYKQTEEHKRRKVDSRRGYKHSEITKKKIGDSHRNKKYNYSKEAKQRMIDAHLGKKQSKETIAKRSASLKGRVVSKETRLKIGNANRGNVLPPKSKEYCDHMREVQMKRIKEGVHNFWKGGISFEEYSLEWTKTLKRSIRERDNFTCKICGRWQSNLDKKDFDVHHIDYNKKNCDPINLITLCHKCHMKTGFNRETWKKFFEIIQNATN